MNEETAKETKSQEQHIDIDIDLKDKSQEQHIDIDIDLNEKQKQQHIDIDIDLKDKSQEEPKIDIDLKKSTTDFINWTKKRSLWLIPLFLILTAMIFAVYFRIQPLDLPVTDNWAESTLKNHYKNQLKATVDADYGDLDDATKASLVDKKFYDYLDEHRDEYNEQVEYTSNEYKKEYQNDEGMTYLLDLDTYTFYANVNNYLENGHFGTYEKDGVAYTDRNAPLGHLASKGNFHEYFLVYMYKFLNLFSGMDLMTALFYFVIILAPLTIIPAFFIGKRISNSDIGGFIAAMMVATHQGITSRTPGGGVDTDIYNVLFPLYIIWMFVETLRAKDLKKKLIFAGLTSLVSAIYSFAWTGWWYVYDVVLGTLVAIIIVEAIKYYVFEKHDNNRKVYDIIKPYLMTFGVIVVTTFVLSAGIFLLSDYSASNAVSKHLQFVTGPLNFVKLKAVGVTSYWPNIMTTVAELNPSSLGNVVDGFGGAFYFLIALFGIGWLLFKDYSNLMKRNYEQSHHYQYSLLLLMWIVATIYPAIKAVRFLMVVTPPLIIAFSTTIGLIDNSFSNIFKETFNRKLASRIFVLFIAIMMINPLIQSGFAVSQQQLPLMNDMWYDSLTFVKNNTAEDAILTSWWDYGYFFTAIAERPVTFDGGYQVAHDAHWVGKSFLTNSENTTIGILRMLDCGQNSAFNALDAYFDDTPRSVDVINDIIALDKEKAIDYLEDLDIPSNVVNNVTSYTHCDAPDGIYITSGDMIKKSGVWGHFGSWDFDRALMYREIHSLSKDEAISKLIDDYGKTASEANQLYKDIHTQGGDNFIASWPSYFGDAIGCSVSSSNYACSVSLDGQTMSKFIIPKSDFDAYIESADGKNKAYPDKVVYYQDDEIRVINNLENNRTNLLGFSIIVIPNQDRSSYILRLAADEQADSIFTKLFFFNGHGMHCFEKIYEQDSLTGDRVIMWKTDWDCEQEINYYDAIVKVNAKHILVTTNNLTDEQAYNKTMIIYNQINDTNFEELAMEYSECPSGADGGDLGWFGKDQMVKEFEDTAFAMDINDIEITRTQFGYHIIKLVNKTEE